LKNLFLTSKVPPHKSAARGPRPPGPPCYATASHPSLWAWLSLRTADNWVWISLKYPQLRLWCCH